MAKKEAVQQEEELLQETSAEETGEVASAEGSEGLAQEGEVVEGGEGAAQDAAQEGDAFAVFGGEEVKVDPRRADAHQATISSVSSHESEKGSRAIRVVYHSDDTGNDITEDIYVPDTFADNVGAFLRRELGIEDLPAGEPDPTRPGKLKGNQRAHYGMTIKNSAGDAKVQLLLVAAAKDGRKPGASAAQIETFDEYTAALNEVLADLRVIVTRRPEVTDENPRGFLRVSGVYSPSILEDAKASKFLKRYLCHWTVGEDGQASA